MLPDTSSRQQRLRDGQDSAPDLATSCLRSYAQYKILLKNECDLAAAPSAVQCTGRCSVCHFAHARQAFHLLFMNFLLVCLYILYVRPFWPLGGPALRANVGGRIGNRVSPAESVFSACIGSGSSSLPGRGLVSERASHNALHSSSNYCYKINIMKVTWY